MALDNRPFFAGTLGQGGTPLAAPQTQAPVPLYGSNFRDPNQMVQDAMGAALDPNSSYIQNARRRGLEVAATRGGINSSIAAGASERAAIDAAAPLAQQALGIEAQREAVAAEGWMSQNNFNRAMMGQYQQAAFTNSLNMLQMVQQYALEDPELYTPDVVNGLSEFFQQNMSSTIGRYFGNRG